MILSWSFSRALRSTRSLSSSAQLRRAEPLAVPAADGSPPQYSVKIEKLVDEISKMTLLEVSELTGALKSRLNLPDAPVMMGGFAPAQARAEDEEEEAPKAVQTSFTVKLMKFDDSKKVALIKECKSLLEGMNLVQVFLAGFNSLVGKSSTADVPSCRKGVLEGSLKVEELSKKSVERIVVGEEFGAALTTSKDLYLWGTDVGLVWKMPEGLTRLALESHYDGAKCSKCSQLFEPVFEDLVQCNKCKGCCQNRVSSLPPPASWTGRPVTVLGYPKYGGDTKETPELFCLKCGVSIDWDTYRISNFEILSCSSCNRLIDGNQYYLIPPQDNHAPHKVTSPTPLLIVDIAAGKTFLLIQTTSQLIIWGDLGGQKYSCAVSNPDKVSFSKVACGSAHIAVISDKGDLYTCGVGSDGQLGYTWAATHGCATLKKVPLDGPAVDVACGLKSTVCLLQNGSHVTYGSVTKIVTYGTWTLNLLESALVSVPSVGFQDEVMKSSLNHLLQPDAKRSIVLTGDLVDTFLILCGLKIENSRVTAEPSMDFSRDLNSANPEQQGDVSQMESEIQEQLTGGESLAVQRTHLAHLFGQHLLSDLTLKLADGDFPVHRSVLYGSSAYFRQVFTDSKTSAVLDMSSYNSAAYRGLLQYFYGVPLSQISCEDMIDLYVLATSYNEDWVAADVLGKLKTSINHATELLQECQAFMNTPEFKNSLLNRAFQNTDAIVEIFRFFSKNKN